MPLLNLCCCCCRLQTGGVVLGYIESFISLILLIVSIVITAKIESVAEALNNFYNTNKEMIEQGKEIHIDAQAFKYHIIAFIVFTAIWLLVSIVLVIGATKRNHKLILPYLGVKIVYFVYTIYEYVSALIGDGDKIMISVQFLIFLGLSIYLWVCVYSLFQEIREQPNAPREAYLMQQQPYNPQVYKPSTIPN